MAGEHQFQGWWNGDFTDQYEAGDEITENTVLVAKWAARISITYVTTIGGAPPTRRVYEGHALTEEDLTPIERTGFTFGGWYDETGTTEYQEGDIITSDVKFYAKWTDVCNISYTTARGTAPNSKIVPSGYRLTASDLTAMDDIGDYEFMGWINNNNKRQYAIGDAVTSDIILKARWLNPNGTFGISWSGYNTSACTRTDDAEDFIDPIPYVSGARTYGSQFDDLLPWSGIEKEDVDGLGTLVKIPKYYYKWSKSGNSMHLQISPVSKTGFKVSPAHAARGESEERDYVYVGRYHCNSEYKSVSGVRPFAAKDINVARDSIHGLNENAWQIDFAMWWTVNMLYLVEYANWDSQKMIGYGCGNNLYADKTGGTDSMPYHTGTRRNAKTTYGTGVQYRYIEDWWANMVDWMDGIYFAGLFNTGVYVKTDPATYGELSDGTLVGSRSTKSDNIRVWNTPSGDLDWAMYPYLVASDGYVEDTCTYASSGKVVAFGGSANSQGNGAFHLNGSNPNEAVSSDNYGCRLMYLP